MRENPAEAERRHLGRATTDVDDHVHSPPQRIDAAANGARDRLVERRHRADACLLRGLEERTALQRDRSDGYPDDRADRAGPSPPSRFLQDRTQIQPGSLEVSDDTVVQRSDRDEFGGGAAEQFGCVLPHSEDALPPDTAAAQRHDGRFVQDDAVTDVGDDRVGGAEIDTEFHPCAPCPRPPPSLELRRSPVQIRRFRLGNGGLRGGELPGNPTRPARSRHRIES